MPLGRVLKTRRTQVVSLSKHGEKEMILYFIATPLFSHKCCVYGQTEKRALLDASKSRLHVRFTGTDINRKKTFQRNSLL